MNRLLNAIRQNRELLQIVVLSSAFVFLVIALVVKVSPYIMLNKAHREKLNVYPLVERLRFAELINAIVNKGYEVIITSTVRLGEISRHGTAHALDLNLLKDGVQYKMSTSKKDWEATGIPAMAKAMKFRWGGDFFTPYEHNGVMHPGYDPVHFDFA